MTATKETKRLEQNTALQPYHFRFRLGEEISFTFQKNQHTYATFKKNGRLRLRRVEYTWPSNYFTVFILLLFLGLVRFGCLVRTLNE